MHKWIWNTLGSICQHKYALSDQQLRVCREKYEYDVFGQVIKIQNECKKPEH